MLNGKVGKDFRVASPTGGRSRPAAEGPCVLVVDATLASRLLLADAVAEAGFAVQTASSAAVARLMLARDRIDLVLVDESVADVSSALDLLIEIHTQFPETSRALVATAPDLASMGSDVDRAGLSFLVGKPWEMSRLQATLRSVLLGAGRFENWKTVPLRPLSASPRPSRAAAPEALKGAHPDRHAEHNVLLRGLLAGLNSVESETQLFELVDTELRDAYQIFRWVCFDEQTATASWGRGSRSAADESGGVVVSERDLRILDSAREMQSVGVVPGIESSDPRALSCIGFCLDGSDGPALTCVTWCDPARRAALEELLRDLRHGLNLTLRRIREAASRALEARLLAQRVSEEIKTPVGALAHAADKLRGEAARAGMRTEWVDRVLSESEKLVETVDQLRTEVLAEEHSASVQVSPAR